MHRLSQTMPLKVRDLIRMIENDGWYQIGQKGSHRQFKHPTKKGRVTVIGKPGDELNIKTERSIFKQAQINRPGIQP